MPRISLAEVNKDLSSLFFRSEQDRLAEGLCSRLEDVFHDQQNDKTNLRLLRDWGLFTWDIWERGELCLVQEPPYWLGKDMFGRYSLARRPDNPQNPEDMDNPLPSMEHFEDREGFGGSLLQAAGMVNDTLGVPLYVYGSAVNPSAPLFSKRPFFPSDIDVGFQRPGRRELEKATIERLNREIFRHLPVLRYGRKRESVPIHLYGWGLLLDEMALANSCHFEVSPAGGLIGHKRVYSFENWRTNDLKAARYHQFLGEKYMGWMVS